MSQYRQVLLRGLRAAARKPTNLSKVTEVKQGPTESPTAFLEWLYQAYRTWTPIDPRAPENQAAIVIQFVSQSAPDIRKKIQKMDGFQGKSLSELVAITQIPTPKTKKQVREFLGTVGYCRLWIPGFAELAQPLYSATRGGSAPSHGLMLRKRPSRT